MFELFGVGMIQADAPGFRFSKVNRKFCEIAGYSEDELLTKTFIGLTHPEDCRRDMSELARVLRGNADSWSIEKRCVRKDGSVIWVGVHGAVLRNDAGQAVRIVAMVNDLTTSKHAAQERHDADSSAKKRKPLRRKKAVVKKTRKSAGRNSSDKRRPKSQ